MPKDFRFFTRLNLVELLAKLARNVRELREGLEEVPGSSIYYHTHRFLQQHHYLSPEPPNDFAFWVTNSLGLDRLGEGLASVDTVRFRSINALKDRYAEILDDFLEDRSFRDVDCQEGEEFHFLSCRTFILPTPYVARDLREFAEILEKVSIDSIYFHMFEARLRLEKGENDFSNWCEEIGQTALAKEVSRLDPYTITLDGLRRQIIRRVKAHVRD
jgi:hypothetical protein